MRVDLQPKQPLSQVVFVQDYLQLVFQDCCFTVYNLATYSSVSGELRQGEPGFCDALVSLIDKTARVDALAGNLLLHFSDGALVSVPVSGADARGAEAWQFSQVGYATVVEKNA